MTPEFASDQVRITVIDRGHLGYHVSFSRPGRLTEDAEFRPSEYFAAFDWLLERGCSSTITGFLFGQAMLAGAASGIDSIPEGKTGQD